MIALATTTVSVLRGTETTVFGDEADSTTVVQSGVPMAIMAQSQASTRAVDQRAQEVEYCRGRAPKGTDIRVGDRIKDERSLEIYTVTGAHQAGNPVIGQDLAVDLTRVPST